MKKYLIFFGAVGCFLIGLAVAAYMSDMFVFFVPGRTSVAVSMAGIPHHVPLFFWQENAWHEEHVTVIAIESPEQKMVQILNSWFAFLYQEQKIDKKVTVQSLLLANAVAYISCDHYPFKKEWSICTKLRTIQALLKTVHENNKQIQRVQMLVQHKIMQDPHLDFSNPWPIMGFLI